MTSPPASNPRLAIVVYCAATFLAFPHEVIGGHSIDLGLVAAWFVPAGLALAVADRSPKSAARVAFFASLATHYFLFHWFYVVTVSYGGMPSFLGLLAPIVPALYVSVFTALFAVGWSFLAQKRARHASVLLIALEGAALWVAVDWLRAHFLGGFPWATLGYALHLDIPLLGLTRVTGVYGLSFLAAWLGLALALRIASPSRVTSRGLVIAIAVLAAAHGVGAVLASGAGDEAGEADGAASGRTVRIAAIQGNIEQGQKWDRDRRTRILGKYLRLSQEAVDAGAEWLVWPETAVPGLIELEPTLASRIGEFARSNQTPLFVGGMGARLDASGTRIEAYFDSAFAIDRLGRVADRYDKIHLVPFGEFVPLRALLGRFFEALATGLSAADVTAGPEARVLEWNDASTAGVSKRESAPRVATPICYELLFPHEVRGFGADGASVMLAMTNDAWYGRTGAPHQFLAMTALRAAENGRWIVRAANTGISAVIDDRGRVRERSALFEDGAVVANVPMIDATPTFYARFGDLFALGCVVWVGWALIAGQRRKDGMS